MENYIVEGNISVKAVLLANRRKVERIYVDPKKKIEIHHLSFAKQKRCLFLFRPCQEKKLMHWHREKHMVDFLRYAQKENIKI